VEPISHGITVFASPIGDPAHHHFWIVTQAESFLNKLSVIGVGVITGPELIGISHHPNIYPASAACTRFKDDIMMFCFQSIPNRIKIFNVIKPHFLLVCFFRPAGLKDRTVHIPFDETNIVFTQQVINCI